jgi:hypothetical protein
LAIKYVSANNSPKTFLQQAIDVSNGQMFGTLSCTLVLHPDTSKALGADLDDLVSQINYGTVGINVWACFMVSNPWGTWGAFPGHSDMDIQSGKGIQGNCARYTNVVKSTIRGEWKDPILAALVNVTPKQAAVARAATTFGVYDSVGTLLGAAKAVFF